MLFAVSLSFSRVLYAVTLASHPAPETFDVLNMRVGQYTVRAILLSPQFPPLAMASATCLAARHRARKGRLQHLDTP